MLTTTVAAASQRDRARAARRKRMEGNKLLSALTSYARHFGTEGEGLAGTGP
jgi:hypothetical protein